MPRGKRFRDDPVPAERAFEIERVAQRDAVHRAELDEVAAALVAELVRDVEVLEELGFGEREPVEAEREEPGRVLVDRGTRVFVPQQIIPEEGQAAILVEPRKRYFLHKIASSSLQPA